MRKQLVKAWNKLPAGAAVTTDPLEQVVLVDGDRFSYLEREGHFGVVEPKRPIPAEVRTAFGRIGRTGIEAPAASKLASDPTDASFDESEKKEP